MNFVCVIIIHLAILIDKKVLILVQNYASLDTNPDHDLNCQRSTDKQSWPFDTWNLFRFLKNLNRINKM